MSPNSKKVSLALALTSIVAAATTGSAAPPPARPGLRLTASRLEPVAVGGTWRMTGGSLSISLSPVVGVFSDGFESGALCSWSSTTAAIECLPPGAVLFLDAASCPSGWSELGAAVGRAVVGVPSGGDVAGAVGSPLSNLSPPTHQHWVPGRSGTTDLAGAHGHRVASFDGSSWSAHDSYGSLKTLITWSNGIDGAGSGTYPLATSGAMSFWTELDGAHEHNYSFDGSWITPVHYHRPYLQL